MANENAEVQKVVIEARVRELVDQVAPGTKISSDIFDVLNTKVGLILTDAVQRCRQNGRVTLKPQDI